MASSLNDKQLERLRAIDTPTICNVLEMIQPDLRGRGYATRPFFCAFPGAAPMVGYARTATIRSRHPSALSQEQYMSHRFDYFDYISTGPRPRVSIVQDLDDQPGFGSFWGEVNSNVHKALGCVGVVTNGSVRDLDVIAPDFQMLGGMVSPSHGFTHLVDFGGTVDIHGMIVRSGDLIHADKHGVVAVPPSVVDRIGDAFDLMTRREQVIVRAAQDPDFSVSKLKAAFLESAKIKE